MDAFERLENGEPACLVEAALRFAKDEYPDLDVAAYLEQVQVMAEGFEIFLAGQTSERMILERLNQFFFGELDFTGNVRDYYDPRNSYLNEVIDRRMGIPITLSVLYQSLASSARVRLVGVNLPGHFLLAFPSPWGHRLYIDVFHGGRWLDWNECADRLRETLGTDQRFCEEDFPAMSNRDILARMLRNLKGIYSKSDVARCLRVQERIVRLLPAEPTERRDLGILYYHNGKPLIAVRTLEDLIDRYPSFAKEAITLDYLAKATREATLIN
jgi:regulator of sirC expression with transglutaminase-like and TPR domain